MDSIYDFIPPLHLGIVSQTGSGKTYMAAKMFANIPHRSIFFNYGMEGYFKKFPESVNYEETIYAMKQTNKVALNTENVNEIIKVITHIWKLKKENPKFAQQDIYFFFDEIQKYSQTQILTDVFNRGRRWHIHGVAICRQIQEMKNLRIISECPHMIFFRMNDVGLSTLQHNYHIKIPSVVLAYINAGEYEGVEFKSHYFCTLYDMITWFIYNKNGELVKKYTPVGIEDIEGEIDNEGEVQKLEDKSSQQTRGS